MWTSRTNGLFQSLWQSLRPASGLGSYAAASPATAPLETSGDRFSLARIADRFPSSVVAIPAIAFFSASLSGCSGSVHASKTKTTSASSEPKKTYVLFGKTGFIAFPAGTKAESWNDSKSGPQKKVTLGGIHVQNGVVFGPGDLLFFKDQNAPELIRAIPKSRTMVKGHAFAANQAMDFVNGSLATVPDPTATLPDGKLGAFRVRPSSLALGVNANADEHYVTEKSEKDGFADLRKAAEASAKTETEELEEAWCFVKVEDDAGRSHALWFEVGVDETGSGVITPGGAWLHVINALGALHAVGVEKLMSVHYHPVPHEKPGMTDWGTSYPSPTDLGGASVIAEDNAPNFLTPPRRKHEKVTVTRWGVWRQRWIGAAPNPNDPSQARTLDDHAARAWRHVLALAPKASHGRDLMQPDVFARFAEIYANPFMTLTFEPTP